MDRYGATILAVLAGLGWGVGEVCTKAVLHTGKMTPFMALAARATIALPMVWAAWWIATAMAAEESARRAGAAGPMGMREWLLLVLGSGIAAGALAPIAFYSALNIGDISKVKPIAFAVAPAAGVLLGWLFLREGMNIQKALGVALVLAGVVVIGTAGGRAHATQPAAAADPADNRILHE